MNPDDPLIKQLNAELAKALAEGARLGLSARHIGASMMAYGVGILVADGVSPEALHAITTFSYGEARKETLFR